LSPTGVALVQTTTDLANMTNRNVPALLVNSTINSHWVDVIGGVVVAITWGSKSYIYTTDGITWTFVPHIFANSDLSAPSTLTNPVAHGGVYSFFDSARARRYYTTDHITFTQVSQTILEWNHHGGQIHLVNGILFLMVASSTQYYTSADGGITWVSRTWPAASGATSTNQQIVWNGTSYLFTTQAAASNTSIWTSPDLVTWTNRTCAFATPITINRVAATNGIFFAFSSVTQTTFCTSSDSGATWTQRTAAATAIYGMVAFVNARYMIFATTRTEVSTDLATWALSIGSGPSLLTRDAIDPNLIANEATSQLVFCSSINVWNAYSAGGWTSMAATEQTTGLVTKSFALAASTNQQLIRAKA